MLDVLISGGSVVDGEGGPARPADVGIVGDRIVAVEPLPGADAGRTIDATGMTVCPGLIDPHSHSDWTVLANPTAESTIRQGVTTEIVGNCGVTYAPLSDASAQTVTEALRANGYPEPVTWRGFGELLDAVAGVGTTQNLAWLVGHSAIREAAEGVPDRMTALLEEAMAAGALGLSTGLEYGAGRQAETGELVALAGVLARRGGLYTSHIRNRDAELAAAVEEFFTIARAAGGWAQLSHLNVRDQTGAPEGAWQWAVARLEQERTGMAVLADMTPFEDGIGLAAGLLPAWLLDDGAATAARRLDDPLVRQRLRRDCDRYWRFVHRGQWERVTLLNSPATAELEGLSFPEIAARLGRDEWDCLFDVLRAAGPDLGSVQLMGRLFTEGHVAEAIRHPLFCLGVDGYTSRVDGPLALRCKHPLFFAGHVHYLAHHVRDRGTLNLETAIHKMTAMVADHFGLGDRGRLRPGAKADVITFDLAGLRENSTRKEPLHYATGVTNVLVNGTVVVDDGVHTGARPGRHLPRRS
ncbi:N-acyl-D-amino-acid deacylase family protein [Amycolatopsis taiwanensis]|uniref:N-acyl-D-amino-acid deacylase family protein n=1 Tax=Amycolatopsis taiwanensis TaxID=342230 RepID=UPI0004858597|nr:amidohydrolase family protein [Amycolatopsis taiwanensis]